MIICVPAPALPRPRPALRLAGPARPVIGLQGCRAARAAARGSRAAPDPSAAPARLGRPPGPCHADQIRERYPQIPRRVSGYNLDSLLPEHGFDVARALVGSESTLVTILHAELRLVPAPAAQALVVLGYPDIASAADAVPRIVPHQPQQLEGLDDRLIRFERERRMNPEATAAGRQRLVSRHRPHPPLRGQIAPQSGIKISLHRESWPGRRSCMPGNSRPWGFTVSEGT
jgi:hypothetical protein